ncbi:MAG: DUF2339 domain-containing protein [Bacteroidia bacterium]
MEIFFLVAIIALLVYFSSTLNTRLNTTDERLIKLTNAIVQLKQQLTEAPVKPAEKTTATTTPPVVEKPIVTPSFIKEEPKPIVSNDAQPAVVKEVIPSPLAAFTVPSNTVNTPPPITTTKPPVTPKPFVPTPPQKSWWDSFKEKNPDLEKFIGEDLISKIGVLILVLGISYFVKFAIDKDWINEPARVGIGILCGALVMGVAHKLRQGYAAFSSVLVAGAVAILYFTIGIAFHDYHLFNQTVAFILMVIITAFSCLVTLSYNRKELGVLTLIGGFAVPFMLSTGEGNYVVLFSYIIILNIGILALAYYRKWNIINILSYAFTVLLYGGWLFKTVQDDNTPYLGALLFGFAFYFIFVLINIINNIRTKGAFSVTELSILASNTFLFYAAGMVILSHYHPEFKGVFTTVLGILNFVYAWVLYKKFGLDKTAVYLLIGLTLTFVTLAIPVQFNGNYITLFWGGEAVLLMWLAQKSQINSYRFGSVVVHGLMAISLIMDWEDIYTNAVMLTVIANPAFITGLFATASVYVVYRLLKADTLTLTQFGINFNPIMYRNYMLVLCVVLAYFTGMLEVVQQAYSYIAYNNSAVALPIIYHLLFSAGLFYALSKSTNLLYVQGAMLFAVVNIVLYTFVFANFPFAEHLTYISTGEYVRIAFYIHYVALALVLYFAYSLIQLNKKYRIIDIVKQQFVLWIAAFFVIYIASHELLLHGLVFSNVPLTPTALKAKSLYADYNSTNELPALRSIMGAESIANTKAILIKTMYPVLWGVLAFVFLIVGIKKQVKTLRVIALSLLGITILKLFLYDIRNVSETGKIVAFILLGVLILIISFVYQKIKVLVLDDATTPTINTENKLNDEDDKNV